jgi:hypothetical protein
MSMLKLRSNFEAVVYVRCFFCLKIIVLLFNRKLTNSIKLRETTKASLLECALAIFQARYAACPPVVGGNRRVSLSELCVLSAFLFYARPDVNRNRMMKHQLRYNRRPSHCQPIMIDIIMLVQI